MSITFPNESPGYRTARDVLLQQEVALRRQMESVAAELRSLPAGGELPEDYLFDVSVRAERRRQYGCPSCSGTAIR